VFEHSREWAAAANPPVRHQDFLQRFRDEYLQVLRVVPDSGIPDSWLAPEEVERLRTFEPEDADDIPSVKLALALQALYISRDKPATRAVYGDGAGLLHHDEWLEVLKAGGDEGELMRMLSATGAMAYLAGAGVFHAARKAYAVFGLAGFAGIGGIGYSIWRWARHPSRQGLRDGLIATAEVLSEVTAKRDEQERRVEAALPVVPNWTSLAASNGNAAVVGRAALHALARDPHGHASAQELAARLHPPVPHGHNAVRAVLRTAPAFEQVFRGRWQVGRPSPRRSSNAENPS
jgi:hypothetical protein